MMYSNDTICVGKVVKKMRKWLADRRKELGWNKTETAQKIGISRQFYGEIEAGRRNPTLATAKAICDLMNLDPSLFFEEQRHETCNNTA